MALFPSSFKMLNSSLKSRSTQVFPLDEVGFDDHIVDRLKLGGIGLRLPVFKVGEERRVFKPSVPFGDLCLSRLDCVGSSLSHDGFSAAGFEPQFYHRFFHYSLITLEYPGWPSGIGFWQFRKNPNGIASHSPLLPYLATPGPSVHDRSPTQTGLCLSRSMLNREAQGGNPFRVAIDDRHRDEVA